jgi:hypothetical protein
MTTYCGYTAREIRKMEEDGTCPQDALNQYANGDADE